MTRWLLGGQSRQKFQNLDTTALNVRKQTPQKTLPKLLSCRIVSKTTKEMVSQRHIKDNKNGKQVNFSFSKILWTSKVPLLAIENDCVAHSYQFSLLLTCTRAIIRQKIYSSPTLSFFWLAASNGVYRACKCYVTAWSKCMATRSNVQIWF